MEFAVFVLPFILLTIGVMPYRTRGSTNSELIEGLKKNDLIHSDRVFQALLSVDRKHYAPVEPYVDTPQSIGHGATISAPHMHAHALELLEPYLQPGNKVLDVGCGSGYLAAAMTYMVNVLTAKTLSAEDKECAADLAEQSPLGVVVGIDVVQPLVDLSIKNVGKDQPHLFTKGFENNFVVALGDGWQGYPSIPLFDAIHVGAAAREMPQRLLEQLASPGRMVIPIGPAGGVQTFVQVDKDAKGRIAKKELFGVSYVPLV